MFWTHKQIEKLIRIFPEGQIVTVVDEKIVGCALSIIVNYDDVKNDHTYAQVTGKETFNTHNPKGNILYGIEVFIHPQYRGLRLARRMYEYRKELCETLNLKAIMFGGRIPNYYKYSDQLRPKEYIDKVKQKEIFDPVLTFQLSNDFHVRKVMRNYLPNDEESKHYACLLQWDNIYYQEPTEEYIAPKTTVRVGLVQWQMRVFVEQRTGDKQRIVGIERYGRLSLRLRLGGGTFRNVVESVDFSFLHGGTCFVDSRIMGYDGGLLKCIQVSHQLARSGCHILIHHPYRHIDR